MGVSYTLALPFALKKYLKAKEEELLWKTQIPISPCKNITFKKTNPLKETKNPSRSYYNNSIITNLKFQNKPKYYLSKILT
jgi:hypothetical protein